MATFEPECYNHDTHIGRLTQNPETAMQEPSSIGDASDPNGSQMRINQPMNVKVLLAATCAAASLALGGADALAATSHGESGVQVSRARPSTPTPERRQAPAAPTPEQILERATAVAATAQPDCQVTEARLLGQVAEGHSFYEAACAAGPGYLLIDTTPPQAIDCTLTAIQARTAREADPEADVGVQCALPANTDIMRVLSTYAQEAGVNCQVDQGTALGKTASGSIIYEIGCAGTQGYWIEKSEAGWQKTECLQVVTQNAACRFTTPEEGAASVKAMLAGSEAAECDVTQARFMGENPNGRFYEAKCAAGNGLIARLQETAVQQIYPCETAQQVGGGCTLTQVAAAPATTEQN